MGQVLPFTKLLKQVTSPTWMARPESWVWRAPAVDGGQPQGFGQNWAEHVGLANLLWLALDMNWPPIEFNARVHRLYMLIFTYGAAGTGTLKDLVELAERNSLREFAVKLAEKPELADVPRYQLAPLLIVLAQRRLGA